MHRISPGRILERIAAAIPEDCRGNFVVIGSLAAGYQLFAHDDRLYMRTKDIDCLLTPRVQAVRVGKEIVESLFAADWRQREGDEWSEPGSEQTPDDRLPAVRLMPPGEPEWFLELLAPPDPASAAERQRTRMETSRGHFGLPGFRYLRLLELDPVPTKFGVGVARLEMLALANLLEHPFIRPELMSGRIEGKDIKRSNKDLGRVLAIARAGGDDMVGGWPPLWLEALHRLFPDDLKEIPMQAGRGIRELLKAERAQDLEEARHTCEFGLLAASPPGIHQLRATGERLVQDAIEPMEKAARAGSPRTPPAGCGLETRAPRDAPASDPSEIGGAEPVAGDRRRPAPGPRRGEGYAASTGTGTSRISRIPRRRASGVKGLGRKRTPSPGIRVRPALPAVYPEMKRTLVRGRREERHSASSDPLIPGRTTSVTRRSMASISPLITARAPAASLASRTRYPCSRRTRTASPRMGSSSSTTRRVSDPPKTGSGASGFVDVSASSPTRGKQIQNVVPCPGALST